ncbi:MAG TPA: VCBS repeat-containing protein [Acidobacteriaceae bacterium]|nr:VCBS repeat-containing protein [Acidobacteriaceae bacterium]
MRRMFFRVVGVLSLPLFCYSIHAQTASDPPAFSFSAPQKILTGATIQSGNVVSVTSTDLNGDGNTDLYGQLFYKDANGNEAFLNIFLTGDGKGGFVLNANSNTNDPNNVNPFFAYNPGGPASPPAVFMDLNRDGNADTLYIDPGLTNTGVCPEPVERQGSISAYLGDGKGNFTPDGYSLPLGDAFSTFTMTTGDFNNDSLQDGAMLTFLSADAVPGCDSGGISTPLLLLNNGDGTFADSFYYVSNIQVSPRSSHLVVGDFNGDGKLDLAFVGKALNNAQVPPPTGNVIQVLYGNGDGTFVVGPTYTSDTTVDNMVAADLNADGKTDLVILTEPKNPSTQFRIVTLLAKQAGGFYWASEVASSNPVTLIGLMDLNNDGKPDLAYYSYDSSTKVTSLRAFPGLGGGKFGTSQLIRNLAPNENDIIAPLKTGGPLDIFYALSYPPNKNIYLYEMLNQSK